MRITHYYIYHGKFGTTTIITMGYLHFIDIMVLQLCCIHHISYRYDHQSNKNIQVLSLKHIHSLLLPHPNPDKLCCQSMEIINHCPYALIIPTSTMTLMDAVLI